MFGSNVPASWSLKMVYVLVILLLCRVFYRAFLKPLHTVQDYIYRANQWTSYFRAHNHSITVLKKAFSLDSLSTENINLIHLEIGLSYYRKKDYMCAAEEFRSMMDYFNQSRLPFSPHYASVIISFYNSGDVATARSLYHKLLKHENRDIKFNTLRSLDTRIFK